MAVVTVDVLNILRPSSSDILYGLRTLYKFLDKGPNYVEKVKLDSVACWLLTLPSVWGYCWGTRCNFFVMGQNEEFCFDMFN